MMGGEEEGFLVFEELKEVEGKGLFLFAGTNEGYAAARPLPNIPWGYLPVRRKPRKPQAIRDTGRKQCLLKSRVELDGDGLTEGEKWLYY